MCFTSLQHVNELLNVSFIRRRGSVGIGGVVAVGGFVVYLGKRAPSHPGVKMGTFKQLGNLRKCWGRGGLM